MVLAVRAMACSSQQIVPNKSHSIKRKSFHLFMEFLTYSAGFFIEIKSLEMVSLLFEFDVLLRL